MVSVATCLNKNDGAKIAQRWQRGSKNSKTLFRTKNLLENRKFILPTFLNKSIHVAAWCRMVLFSIQCKATDDDIHPLTFLHAQLCFNLRPRAWCSAPLHQVVLSLVWQYGLQSFQARGTKLERFLPNNQHT